MSRMSAVTIFDQILENQHLSLVLVLICTVSAKLHTYNLHSDQRLFQSIQFIICKHTVDAHANRSDTVLSHIKIELFACKKSGNPLSLPFQPKSVKLSHLSPHGTWRSGPQSLPHESGSGGRGMKGGAWSSAPVIVRWRPPQSGP